MSVPNSHEDLGLNLWGDLVSHDGLELWLLQADVREEETLVVWVQLPHNRVLGTQREQVPLPNRAEGSLCSVCNGVIDIVAMGCQLIRVSHEDHLALPLGADRADQLPLEGIKLLGCLGPLQGPELTAGPRLTQVYPNMS